MLTGTKLIADIDASRPGPGEVCLWWLGQQSFVVKLGQAVVFLDPFLSNLAGRLVAPLLAPGEIHNADFILGSHDHTDHIDRAVWPALAAASPQARFVVPELLRERLAKELAIPLARFIGLDDGQTVETGGVNFSAIAAAHEFLDQDPQTHRYPYLSYIIEGQGCALFHAGDTCIYEGQQTKLRRWKFDVACLPINGRDAVRYAAHCIGNMTYQEAADLAGALRPRLTIPAHYDMFAMNPGSPTLFADYMRVKYPHLNVQVCEYGRRVQLAAKNIH